MHPNFYRMLACLGILAGLASCNRATYSFAGQDTYLPAPTDAVTTLADLPTPTAEAAGPTPGAGSEAGGPAQRARHRAPRPHTKAFIHSAELVAAAHFVGISFHLHARLAARRHQNTAASGALIPDSAFNGLGQALILIAVLFCLAVGAVMLLVVKATMRVVEGRPHKEIYPAAPRATP